MNTQRQDRALRVASAARLLSAAADAAAARDAKATGAAFDALAGVKKSWPTRCASLPT